MGGALDPRGYRAGHLMVILLQGLTCPPIQVKLKSSDREIGGECGHDQRQRRGHHQLNP
jgi:hypothetical protein